jgi:hypothetical protein
MRRNDLQPVPIRIAPLCLFPLVNFEIFGETFSHKEARIKPHLKYLGIRLAKELRIRPNLDSDTVRICSHWTYTVDC